MIALLDGDLVFLGLRRLASGALALFLASAICQVLLGHETAAACGAIVVLAAFLPIWLWATRRAHGYPIFPAFAFTYAYVFGLQFLTNPNIRQSATDADLWRAALAIGGFLLVGTAVWLPFAARARPQPARAWLIGGDATGKLFAVLLVFSVFCVTDTAGWVGFLGPLYATARALIGSPGILSAFVLCYWMGRRELPTTLVGPTIFLVSMAMLSLAVGLLLFQSIALLLLCLTGYVLGGGRVPWRTLAIGLAAFAVLHAGKFAMRDKYWSGDYGVSSQGIQPWQYPAYFYEWLGYGLAGLGRAPGEADDNASLLERSSLLQMFLLVQDSSPDPVPYLHGKTYRGVPALLIPRLISPIRASPTENNSILSIHYGLQDEQGALTTSIGWGLLNEAFANFGLPGIFGLAVALAAGFGAVTRFTMSHPVQSFRGLLAVLVISICLQTEFSAGFFASVFSQSFIALLALAAVLMRPAPLAPA